MSAVAAGTTALDVHFGAREQLATKVQRLANLRADQEKIDGVIHLVEASMRETNATLYAEEKRLMEAVKQTDLEIRAETLDFYAQTGEKRPVAGVEVKIATDMTYDRAKADAWSIAHDMARVPAMLDVKVFEKIVKSGVFTFDFVTLEDKPTATIARDLTKTIGEATHA